YPYSLCLFLLPALPKNFVFLPYRQCLCWLLYYLQPGYRCCILRIPNLMLLHTNRFFSLFRKLKVQLKIFFECCPGSFSILFRGKLMSACKKQYGRNVNG